MCCSASVSPLQQELAESILHAGQFRHVGGAWVRNIEEEGTSVAADFYGGRLQMKISPSITTQEHHAERRIAAGVMFSIAAAYAEKVGGTIRQHANIQPCTLLPGIADLVVAEYPMQRIDWTNVCHGFRVLLMGDAHD